MKKCRHCGSAIKAIRRSVFCSGDCENEHKIDKYVNLQRLNSFQVLADRGTWVEIDNHSLYTLSNPERRAQVLEHYQFQKRNYYRLTSAGHRLLERWKSQLQVAV